MATVKALEVMLEEKLSLISPADREEIEAWMEGPIAVKRLKAELERGRYERRRPRGAVTAAMKPLSTLRKEFGLSQAALARHGALSQLEVSRLELCAHDPLVISVDKYVAALEGRLECIAEFGDRPSVLLADVWLPHSEGRKRAAAKPPCSPDRPDRPAAGSLEKQFTGLTFKDKGVLAAMAVEMAEDRKRIADLMRAQEIERSDGEDGFSKKALPELRQDFGLSCGDLEMRMGLKPGGISDFESRGTSSHKVGHLAKYISALGKGACLKLLVTFADDRPPAFISGLTGGRTHVRTPRKKAVPPAPLKVPA